MATLQLAGKTGTVITGTLLICAVRLDRLLLNSCACAHAEQEAGLLRAASIMLCKYEGKK